MDILDSILEKWTKEKDVESLISEGLFTDLNAIQLSLDKLSGERKDSTVTTLNEIQSAILLYIEHMSAEKLETQNQIDSNLMSEKACLSYGSSIDIQNKGKGKDKE